MPMPNAVIELHPSSSDGASQPDASNDARARVLHWMHASAQLSYVYARSGGGLLEVGRASVASFSDQALHLNAGGSKLIVLVQGARLGTEPQAFFSPGFTSVFYVDGVSFQLPNCDWLFLSGSAQPEALAYSGREAHAGSKGPFIGSAK